MWLQFNAYGQVIGVLEKHEMIRCGCSFLVHLVFFTTKYKREATCAPKKIELWKAQDDDEDNYILETNEKPMSNM